ncbi:MAG: alpha/beta hydrolase [Robiginitomaculum sp.]|nr:MAG: alpha/beta hydrolase [Robiginitomaculum sp.]
MVDATQAIKPPSLLLLLLEGRAVWEYGALIASRPMLNLLPKGDGHPVLVLPGLAGTDLSTKPLRKFLESRGYTPAGWELGRNLGLREGLLEQMLERLDELYEEYGEKISIIGWSLGGIFARELAKLRPEQVRMVITLGSPHSGNPKASNARKFYERVSGHKVDNPPLNSRIYQAPPVPTTSIYTKTDGIVAWQNCHQAEPKNKEKARKTENIQVMGSHCGLGINPSVLYIIADRLALREGSWTAFSNHGFRKAFFETPGFHLPQAS